MNELLLYTGGALPMLWGAAHLYPTRKVVEGFGAITRDNQLVLTMEWIAEAILLLFIGTLVIVTTARFGADGAASETTFAASALALLVLAGVSAATGGRSTSSCTACAPRSSRSRRRLPLVPGGVSCGSRRSRTSSTWVRSVRQLGLHALPGTWRGSVRPASSETVSET